MNTWLVFYLILLVYSFAAKLMTMDMAKKVMEEKRWPPSEILSAPKRDASLLDSLRQPLYGADAIRTAKRYVIMADVFLWCVAGSFILSGIFLWES